MEHRGFFLELSSFFVFLEHRFHLKAVIEFGDLCVVFHEGNLRVDFLSVAAPIYLEGLTEVLSITAEKQLNIELDGKLGGLVLVDRS